MADPFDVRVRFTSQLHHLNASVTSAQKAAQYAIKYRDMDEDLHSCILEELDRSSINHRANIIAFIEHLCDLAQKENHPAFVHMIQRDMGLIIDATAPPDGSGAANVKLVRRVLHGLQQKHILDDTTVDELLDRINDRDAGASHGESPPGMMEEMPPPAAAAGPVASVHVKPPDNHTVPPALMRAGKPNGITKLDKRQVEQRIEEDRERHKRLREHIWAVSGDGDDELLKLCEEMSDVDEDDPLAAEESAAMRADMAQYYREMKP